MMQRAFVLLSFLALTSGLLHAGAASPSQGATVKVGQAAPPFTLHYLAKGANGKFEQQSVSLADFKGKKTVILAFFPAAFSPG